MPRQRGSVSRAPSRPTVPSKPAAPAKQQTRPAATYAAHNASSAHPPTAVAAPPPAGSQGPGLFGQMASTAAGVAVGSSIGHAIGGLFGGGSSTPEPGQTNAAPPAEQNYNSSSVGQQDANCGMATKRFTQCMDEQNGNMDICNWYLDQLKACQTAASQYK